MGQKVDAIVLAQLADQGQADYWIVFDAEPADLSGAAAIDDWGQRGEFVYNQLRQTAAVAQASVRDTLDREGASYQAFWLANSVYVKGGDEALTRELVEDSSIARIVPDEVFEIEPPQESDREIEDSIDSIEWGVHRIGAPRVWSDYGVLGEDIVVANIDTGVDFDHPALVRQYRGSLGNGTFSHDYNWYDPSNICAGDDPCDNNDHGTHTMGTVVGDDGGANQIGVAPGATWIAAKGCEYGYCSLGALLASGQWMLAPTDRNGQNPRPDLRPHIINNSWGGYGGRDFYQHIVDAWVASGIFPAFSAGNLGSSCGTAGSPGDYVNSYATGATDSGDNIAYFSSRGPSAFNGETKPDIAAPGVNVRSSTRSGGYRYMSGTSMASPHTAGAVALLWSAAPSLIGDIEGTRALLDQTAENKFASACGGTADDNNVFGEGMLDALAAVEAAPRGPSGRLSGTVRAAGGQAVAGARIVARSDRERAATSGQAGSYSLRLAVGSYDVSVRAFGYLDQRFDAVSIAEDQTTTLDLILVDAPIRTVTGRALDDQGQPAAGLTVSLPGTPIASATTDENGMFQLSGVPEGSHRISVTGDGRCLDSMSTDVIIDGQSTIELTVPRRADEFGYTCWNPQPEYIEAQNRIFESGTDSHTSGRVNLPFSFPFYGENYNSLYVCRYGYVTFEYSYCTSNNYQIPYYYYPNGAIYPFWDSMYMDYYSSVHTDVIGEAPNRKAVIEWRNMRVGYYYYYRRVDFEIVLHEGSGKILMQYRNIDNDYYERAASATIGIENRTGNIAFQYSYNEPVLEGSTWAIEFSLPPSATVQGMVTDLNDSLPLSGATVRVLDAAGTERQRVITGADGNYSVTLPLSTYTIEASAQNYATERFDVVLDQEDAVIEHDFSLATARGDVTPGELHYIVLTGESRPRTVTLSNTGSLDMQWNACAATPWGSCTNLPWLSASPSGGTLAPGESQDVTITVDGAATDVGVYTAAVVFTTNSGRNPIIDVDVNALIVAYRQGINAGDCSGNTCQPYTDTMGDIWAADQMWQAGSWGHVLAGSTKATNQPIENTVEDPLYQTQRVDPYAYRFDALPDGVYQIELEFAEITPNQGIGERLFDVIIENEEMWPAYDIVYEAGLYTAHSISYFVTPTDGDLEIQLAARLGSSKPVINALRVTHRPDM